MSISQIILLKYTEFSLSWAVMISSEPIISYKKLGLFLMKTQANYIVVLFQVGLESNALQWSSLKFEIF